MLPNTPSMELRLELLLELAMHSRGAEFSRYHLVGFDQAWSTVKPSSLTSFGYDAMFGIKETFFDTINFSASFDLALRESLGRYKSTGSFALEITLGFDYPFHQTSMSVSLITA
jgi:hypothetical protein